MGPTKAQQRWRDSFPVNAAIFDVAAEMTPEEIAAALRVSVQTVYSWRRTKAVRAPKSALALLCHEIGAPSHPLSR
jgi:hypothetical protein